MPHSNRPAPAGAYGPRVAGIKPDDRVVRDLVGCEVLALEHEIPQPAHRDELRVQAVERSVLRLIPGRAQLANSSFEAHVLTLAMERGCLFAARLSLPDNRSSLTR